MQPGAPDGVTILAVHDAGGLRANVGVAANDAASFDAVVAAWVAWFRPRAGRVESPAWIPDRLEYRFAMTAPVAEGTVTLSAPEHTGGALEWFTFTGAKVDQATAATPVHTSVDVAPTLLHIAGMPALTFWEVEDPSFDPGRIDAAPGDTARLLVVEAALAVAADWFLVPLRLPVAALSRIDHLLVTDTFGVTTEVLAADAVRPHPAWALWRVPGLPYLLLPPPAAGNLLSEPDEQVAIVRDEDANLAWALQLLPQVDATPAGGGLGAPSGAVDLTYVPITPVDADRVPLVLVEEAGATAAGPGPPRGCAGRADRNARRTGLHPARRGAARRGPRRRAPLRARPHPRRCAAPLVVAGQADRRPRPGEWSDVRPHRVSAIDDDH